MNVIISNYPEDLEVPQEYVENVTAAAQKVGELYGVENGEVSITLTNNDYIHELNESEEPEVTGGADLNVLGDLVISVERAEEQAKDFGHSVKREMAFLTVHGMLHLLGYDHMEEEERLEMEREQRFVMEKLGIPRE